MNTVNKKGTSNSEEEIFYIYYYVLLFFLLPLILPTFAILVMMLFSWSCTTTAAAVVVAHLSLSARFAVLQLLVVIQPRLSSTDLIEYQKFLFSFSAYARKTEFRTEIHLLFILRVNNP